MEYLSSREKWVENVEQQLRILREEESRTVEISHPRTRIQGVFYLSAQLPQLGYVAFLGIPYALPPVGKLRFQPPQRLPQLPPDRPTELFLADNGSHPCTQPLMDKNIGSEDCLYLNVFTPRKPKDIPELLPVLVYIHGGGFSIGENDDVNPEILMGKDLVVVTINYRLGIFGFLNMRTETCLGNVGMKDQVMALEWVRDNIEPFKGNPKNVTICGHCAGGSCVNLHMLSPLSKGLFHKAIVMSGGVYTPWGYGGHANYVKDFFKNAIFHSKELRHVAVDNLKRKKTFDLMKLYRKAIMANMTKEAAPLKMKTFFKPTVECMEEGAFLPDTMEKLMAAAEPVPTMAGITKQEGYIFFSAYARYLITYMKGETKFVELVKDVLRQNLSWKDPTAVDRHFGFFKEKYFPEEWMFEEEENVEEDEEYKPMTEEERQRKDEEKQWKDEERKHRLATLCTDILFRQFYDNFKIGNLLDGGGPPLYVYEFDYFAGLPIQHDDQPVNITRRGAGYGDDYFYLFGTNQFDKMLKRIAKKDCGQVRLDIESVQSNMSKLWSSFCRTGHPTIRVEGDAQVNWEPHAEQDPHYLRIGKELRLMSGRLNEERWPALNAIIQLEPTIPSLPVSPQRSKKKCTELQQSQPQLCSSSTQAPDTDCEVVQHSRPKFAKKKNKRNRGKKKKKNHRT